MKIFIVKIGNILNNGFIEPWFIQLIVSHNIVKPLMCCFMSYNCFKNIIRRIFYEIFGIVKSDSNSNYPGVLHSHYVHRRTYNIELCVWIRAKSSAVTIKGIGCKLNGFFSTRKILQKCITFHSCLSGLES